MNGRIRGIIVIALLLSSVVPIASAQDLVSCPGWFQDWRLRSNDTPFVKIAGKVDFIRINDETTALVYENDHDWNIFIDPTPEFDWVTRNRAGVHNKVIESGEHLVAARRIEAEVKAFENYLVASRFAAGTNVIAEGWWTEDSRHDDKTEVHPLLWIMSTDGNPKHLFAAVDHSTRFAAANQGLNRSWDFELPPSSTTMIFEEEASTGFDGRASVGQSVGKVTLSVELDPQPFRGPPAVECGEWLGVSVSNGSYYLGSLKESAAPLFTDQVTFSVVEEESKKVGKLRVVASLTNPPQGPLEYSEWQHTAVAGFDPMTTLFRENAPHTIEVTWDYRPDAGDDRTVFWLNVFGSTHEKDAWLTGEYRRTVVQDRRRYEIIPSSIGLVRTVKGYVKGCPENIYYNIDFSKMLPGVGVAAITWKVQKLVTVSPDAGPTNPPFIVVTPNSPYIDADVTVKAYPAPDNARLDVEFTPPGNFGAVAIVAEVTTELGERADAGVDEMGLCGFQGFPPELIYEYVDRLRRHFGLSGEIDTWPATAPTRERPWTRAFLSWASNRRLTADQERVLVAAVRRGELLPARPPKASLKVANPRQPAGRTTIQLKGSAKTK